MNDLQNGVDVMTMKMNGCVTTAIKRSFSMWNVMDNKFKISQLCLALQSIVRHVKANNKTNPDHIRCWYVLAVAEDALKRNKK